MARKQYVVIRHEGAWMIAFDGRHYGPYDNQAIAIRLAVDAAHGSGQNGHDAQVLVQELVETRIEGGDHAFRTEWTYGQDPYPPPV